MIAWWISFSLGVLVGLWAVWLVRFFFTPSDPDPGKASSARFELTCPICMTVSTIGPSASGFGIHVSAGARGTNTGE